MQRLHPLPAPACGDRPGRARPAGDRAGNARAGRDGHGQTHLHAALGRRDAVRIRGLRPVAASLRSRHRAGRGGCARQPARARIDLHGRRLGRPLGARAREGSQVPRTPTGAGPRGRRRRTLHRGRNPDVAPAGRRTRPASRGGQGDRVPGDRLRPSGREPFHEPSLLGGRGTQRPDALGLDGTLPRRRRRTRQPAAGALPRLLARAGAGDDEGAGRSPVLAFGLHLLGQWPRGTADVARARHVRRARSPRGALGRHCAGAGSIP